MNKEKFTVKVKFRSSIDVSNPNKTKVIDALGGPYKEKLEALSSFGSVNYREFTFNNIESANNFGNRLFEKESKIFDIKKEF